MPLAPSDSRQDTGESRLVDAHPGHADPDGAALSGSELIRATRRYAVDDPLRSWWYLLSTSTLLVVTLAATLWIPATWGRLLAGVLAGLLTLRLFVIYHDHQHRTILPASRLAGAVMFVFGLWALSPGSVWRSSHNHHHRHNSKLRGSHIGSFPIMTAKAFGQTSRLGRFHYLFQRHPLTLLFGYVFVFLFGMCLYPWMNHPRRHWDGLAALVLHAAVGTALVVGWGWDALIFTQTLPCVVACASGSYLFYVQHNFPGVMFRDQAHWTYETAALESSSFLKLPPILAWFTANIGYHHIHHLNPKIPFYRLPEAMRGIPGLQAPKTTSLSPGNILSSLRLKVWDAERGCMTGVPRAAR